MAPSAPHCGCLDTFLAMDTALSRNLQVAARPLGDPLLRRSPHNRERRGWCRDAGSGRIRPCRSVGAPAAPPCASPGSVSELCPSADLEDSARGLCTAVACPGGVPRSNLTGSIAYVGWGAQIQSDRLEAYVGWRPLLASVGIGRGGERRHDVLRPATALACRGTLHLPAQRRRSTGTVILCLRVGASVQGKATGPRRLVNAGSKSPLGVGDRADRIARKFMAAIGRPGNGNVRRASPHRRRAGRGHHGTVATSCTCAAVRRTPRVGRPALIPRSHQGCGPHPHGAEMPRWTGERTR